VLTPTLILILILAFAVTALLAAGLGAAYGGRHAHTQSLRADRAESRARVSGRLAALEAAEADAAHQQLATLRAALRRTAPPEARR
jgi:hypothetical protein